MINNYKKFILIFLVLIGILIFLFFLYKNYLEEKIIIEPDKEPTEFLIIDIGTKTLVSEGVNFIYSSTLQLEFNITVSKNIDIQSLTLKLDNFENILLDKFYGETNIDEIKRKIVFQSSFMFTPEKHELSIEYKNLDGKLLSKKFTFILTFIENFEELLEYSRVWIIPQNRPSNWFNVKDGKLLVKPATDDVISSLAFLYTFNGDITVDFELTPIEERVSTIFYFLEIGSFSIGSNDNKTIVLLLNNQPDLFGRKLKLTKGHRYHVRIRRKNFQYTLAIKELFDEKKLSPTDKFSEENILLNYTAEDSLNGDQIINEQNHIGFSFWKNTEGVFIDDIFITGFTN